nr:MAG: hypothetical protein [Bacteriophage sp.]
MNSHRRLGRGEIFFIITKRLNRNFLFKRPEIMFVSTDGIGYTTKNNPKNIREGLIIHNAKY